MRSHRGALACLALSLAGIGLCGYLAFLHIALLRGELLGGTACSSAGTMFNCHAVTASPLGSVFGIPLALWGLIGYLATASLAFIGWQFPDWTSKALTSVVALGLVFLAIDAVLFVAMTTQIRYFCLLCMLTYLVNLLLLVTAKSALSKPWREILRQIPASLGAFLPQPHVAVSWMFWGIMLTGTTGTLAVNAATHFVSQGTPGALRKQMAQFVGQQQRVSVETSQDPILGAPDRAIRIVEFSDFLCPSCQRASKLNVIILAGHRRDVAFVFKHFPLDTACNTTISRTVHSNACQLAAATECAHEQGKFWALHDLIFEKGPQYHAGKLEDDVIRLGLNLEAFRTCMQTGRGLEAVKQDIAEAARLRITSTPTYIVNGIPLAGVLTPAMFEEFLQALRQSGQ